MSIFKRIIKTVISKFEGVDIKYLSISIILSCFILLGSYLFDNFPYPIFDKIETFSWTEKVARKIGVSKGFEHDDAFFINVGYDKDTCSIEIDELDKGVATITNRKTLIDFLNVAKESEYKLIFLDIRFEKGYNTVWDDSLFHMIKSMKNVYCSHHSDIQIADSCLLPKAIINDYFTTITSTNFTRYQFMQDGKKSVPLVIDSVLNGNTFDKFGPFYFRNGKLCQNSPYTPILSNFKIGFVNEEIPDCYDLGPFLLTIDKKYIKDNLKNKIVVVGDFTNDKHDTYTGLQPGSYLIYLAYKYIEESKNVLNIWFQIFLFGLYLIIIYRMLRLNPLLSILRLDNFIKSKILKFCLTFLSYGSLLFITSIILYLTCQFAYNIFLPSLAFTLVDNYNNYKKL